MGSRSRNRNHTQEYGLETITYNSLGGIITKHYGVEPFIRMSEKMDDTVGFMENDFNPCLHYKYIVSGKPVDVFGVEVLPSQFETYSVSNGGVHCGDALGAFRNYDFGIQDWLDDFGARAEQSFKEAVQDKNSILNFIIELIELLEGNLSVAKRVSRNVQRGLDAFWRVYRKTGNYWLAWNFGIKPTISDIKSMIDTIERAQKRLKWLRQHNHVPTKVHYREPPRSFSGVIDTLDPTWFTVEDGGDPILLPKPPELSTEITYECEIEITAWAWVRFDIPDYLLWDDLSAVSMIGLTLQGVYNPLKVVWEAVPFSWLIDWFLSARTQLLKEKASLSPFPDAVLLGTGHTVHVKKMTGTMTLLSDGPSGTIRYAIGEYFYDCYDRRPGLPSGDPAVRPSVPNAWQTSILAAIGGQRLAKRRRR